MRVEADAIQLTAIDQRFILHWGEMGNRWGINRTMAQIHALLFLSPEPLHAEQITGTLQVARSNVSTCLRELQSWGIVRIVHVLGDRRDHFESLHDVWEMFRIILDERKRREIDPTREFLHSCISDADSSDDLTSKRIGDVLEFFEAMSTWYESITTLPDSAVKSFIKLGPRVQYLIKGKPSKR